MDFGIWSILLIICKTCLYASGLVAMGSGLYVLVFGNLPTFDIRLVKTTRNMIFGASLLGIITSVLFLLLQTGFIVEEGIGGMFDVEMLEIFLDENIGTSLYLRVAGLILLMFISLFVPKLKILMVLPLILIAASFSIIGHATGEYQVFTSVLLIIHLLAVSFWLGALLPLYVAADQPHAEQLLEKFGKIASYIVPLLIVVGLIFAALILGSFSALFGSSYGITLIIKIAIVGLLLGLATLNKYLLVPQIAAQAQGSIWRLRAVIAIEALAFMGIFLMTAILTTAVTLPE